MSLICIGLFVLGGCRRESKWEGHTFEVVYTWDGQMKVLKMTDTLTNKEVNDPALKNRVLEESNLKLAAWVQASKLKRATGIFHIRFLSGGASQVVETTHGTEGGGSEFIKDPDVTPLMTAAHEGHLDRLEELIKEGQKINATDQLGNTALMAAVASHNPGALRFLLDQGADVNARNRDGETALSLSAFSGQLEMVSELTSRGAVFDCANPVDRETLLGQERRGNLRVVSVLKKVGIHCSGVTANT
jgi:hypothetical protein